MNSTEILWLMISIALPNALVFIFFKKLLLKRDSPGMRFLVLNLFKDAVWCLAWLRILAHTKANFLSLVLVFLFGSFILYFFVIKELNKI